MATGRSAKLTGQVGEFLVCAELGRCGIIATPFAGNVPEFDVVATGEGLVTVPIQVKAGNGTSEQRLDRWLDVEYDSRRRRHHHVALDEAKLRCVIPGARRRTEDTTCRRSGSVAAAGNRGRSPGDIRRFPSR